ncbi:hypothetical protein [Glycomyces salinus]|uniref:hypothetical protein n=1 Tax=Glycomyces salinus TaxID=980294 RepID=UPI0018ED2E96|nr:hypothetical protein [Glycomyces salinus]
MTEEAGRDAARPSTAAALAASVGVSVAQALTIVLVFMLFLAASTSEASNSDDPWAGFGTVFIGLFAAPTVAVVVGVIVAWKLRLRVFGWYALAPAAAFAAMFGFGVGGVDGSLVTAVLAGVTWNLVVAALAGRKRTTVDDS